MKRLRTQFTNEGAIFGTEVRISNGDSSQVNRLQTPWEVTVLLLDAIRNLGGFFIIEESLQFGNLTLSPCIIPIKNLAN